MQPTLTLLAALLGTTTPTQPSPEVALAVQSYAPLRSVRQVPLRGGQRGAVVVRAQQLQGVPGQTLHLNGKVELRHGDTLLTAPSLRYNEALDEVQSDGRVRIEHLGNSVEGEALRLRLDAFVGELLMPNYRLSVTGGSGQAARMDFLGGDRMTAEAATYSSCPRVEGQEPAWELRTDRMSFDTPANEGRAEGAVLRFQGVPILAAPSFTFPLTSERKSGWLPPHIGFDNRSGIELAVPYYANPAPNYDLTLTPFTMTRRGFGVDAEFRGLQPWGDIDLDLSLLPNDTLFDRKRWLWRAAGQATPWKGMQIDVRGESVSDQDYWKDLRRRIESSTPRLLARNAIAEQSLTHLGLNGALYARAQSWQVQQTLDTSTQIVAPYQRAPQVGLRLRSETDAVPLAGFMRQMGSPRLEASMELEYNRFTLPQAALAGQDPGGERVHLLTSVAMPFVDSGWWLTPRLALNAAEYRTQQAMSDGRRQAGRTVPTASVDAGMIFERDTRLLGRNLQQTLEPRVLYVQTPYRDQARLPNYDSAPLDFNVESLYAMNAFSGVDRVSDARQLSFGGTSRWMNPQDGEELLRLGLVQRYLLRPQRTTDIVDGVNRRFSDLLLAGSAHLRNPWWLDGVLQYNPDSQRTVRSVLRARYSPGEFRTVSLAYRLTRDQNEQLDLAWQWPLWSNKAKSGGACKGGWYTAGRIQYSLKDSRVTDSLVGLEYDAGCWVMRVGIERLSTGRAEANTRYLLQLELVGLSRFGSNALKVLRDNVPGYRPLASDSGPSSLP